MKKQPEGHENHERWMVSYADFLTLLFAVFVVLYSFAMSKQSEAQSMVQGLIQSFNETGLISSTPGVIALPGPIAQNASTSAMEATQTSEQAVNAPVQGGGGVLDFGVTTIATETQTQVDQASSDSEDMNTSSETSTEGNLVVSEVTDPTSGREIKDFNTQEQPNNAQGIAGTSKGEDPDYLDDGGTGPTDAETFGEGVYGYPFDAIKESISDAIADSAAKNDIILEDDGRWLTINMSSGLLFAQGSASILSSSRPVLEEIGKALSSINNYVRVRGYTDNVFEDTGTFANNWDLSAGRALSVLNELSKNGIDPTRLALEGYGQYSPFYSNSTRAGRAQNNRVVIAISRYAVSGRKLDVIQGDSEQLRPTPEAVNAVSGSLEMNRNDKGVIELNFGQ